MKIISALCTIFLMLGLIACGSSDSDPANVAPTASAPSDFSQPEQTEVSLSGSNSSDSDGTIASYAWAQSAGTPSVTLNNATSATTTFTAPEVTADTPLTFTLTVTDNDGATGTDTVVVTITPDQPPQAVAPVDFEAAELTSVSLDGTGSSDDVAIASYLWAQTAGQSVTLSNPATATASFTAPEVTNGQPIDLMFDLTVTDSLGASSTDSVNISIIDAPTAVTLSGKLTYDHVQHAANNSLDYNNIIQSNIRGATVELLDSTATTILQTTASDGTGQYSFVVAVNTTYVIRTKAELKQTDVLPSWDFTVVDNTSSQAIYAMDSSTQAVALASVALDVNAASGWTGSAYTETRVAASFAILDSVFEAKEKVVAVDANAALPALMLNWSVNNVAVNGDKTIGQISTSHYDGTGIYILGDADSDTDEYDGHVIVHEWGHYFEGQLSRSDSVGGSHSGGDKLDMRVAMGEGWGNALSGIVTDDPFYRDSYGTGQSQGFDIDVESDGLNNEGWFSERSVYILIYDFYDSNDDGADTLSLGFGPIYNVMVGDERTTPAFTSIYSFVNALKRESSSSVAAIDAQLSVQSIIVNDAFGTGETNNGGDARNLPVYQSLAVGTPVEACSYGTNGQYNKLGNRKFITLDIATSGSYTITAVGQSAGDDPDFHVYSQGVEAFKSEAVGNESATQQITAGQYVMDVYEYTNIQGTVRDTCIDLTLTAN